MGVKEASRIVDSVRANAAMWSQIESAGRELDQAANIRNKRMQIVVGMVTGTSLSLTAGYLIWLLRGGSLLATVLAAMPMWRSFDPLPVLAFWNKRRKRRRLFQRKGAQTEEEIERMEEAEIDKVFGFSDNTTKDETRSATT